MAKKLITPNLSVRIGYKDYKIVEKDNVMMDHSEKGLIEVYGLYKPDPQIIDIQTKLSPQNTVRIMLHEILHGIEECMNLSFTEEDIDRVATGLTMVFRDNPVLMRAMVSHAGMAGHTTGKAVVSK